MLRAWMVRVDHFKGMFTRSEPSRDGADWPGAARSDPWCPEERPSGL